MVIVVSLRKCMAIFSKENMTHSPEKRIQSIVVLGGGSAGWMTAATLARMLKPEDVKITVVESEQIGTVGVGEATIPDIINFNRLLGIDEQEFMKATNATFKLGIEFNNWGKIGDKYMHPFGHHGADMMGIDFHQFWLYSKEKGNPKDIWKYSLSAMASYDNKFTLPGNDPRSVLSQLRYAYHFDATLYAKFLRKYAEDRGVTRKEGKVDDVFEIEELVEKPEVHEAKSNLAVAARYVFSSKIFDCLARTSSGKGNEIQLTDLIQMLMREGGDLSEELFGK